MAAPPTSSFDQILNGHSVSLLANEERLLTRSLQPNTTTTINNNKSHPSLPILVRDSSVHKGSIYNYRQAVKSLIHTANTNYSNEQMRSTAHGGETVVPNSDTPDTDISSGDTCSTRYEIVVAPPAVVSAAQKRLERARLAREKILHAPPTQRVNLNKMTILAPFEQTKILVNLDKVPSHVWTCLINKNFSTPKYHIPPARAYGFFKTTNSHHAASSGGIPHGEQMDKLTSISKQSTNPKSISRVSYFGGGSSTVSWI